MKYTLFFLFSNLLCAYCFGAAEDLSDEKQEISFYRGYLFWKECLQRSGMPYDLEQVIAGIKAAENGVGLTSFQKENLQVRVRAFQEKLLAKQIEENLVVAEAFLAKLEGNAVELVPKKLYYKKLQDGENKAVQPESTPLLTYTMWAYTPFGEKEIISTDDPLPIWLKDTIPGFAQGVVGMLEGEERQLFIHPDLAYGVYGKLDPNQLVVFKVKVICAQNEQKK